MKALIDQAADYLRKHPSRVYGYLTTLVIQLAVLVPGISADLWFRLVCLVLGIGVTEKVHAKVSPTSKHVPGSESDGRVPADPTIPPVIGMP